VIGDIVGHHVQIQRTQRAGNSPLRPQFTGSLMSASEGCRLTGTFSFTRTARVFLRNWFVFAILWTVGTSIVVAVQSDLATQWFVPAAGLGALGVGAILVRYAKRYYALDEKWLLQLLAKKLDGTVRSDRSH
jgi:hypothetical protein